MADFIITDRFPGGNIILERIEGDQVFLNRDLRDSDHWFFWAFGVEGAAGKTLTFTFPEDLLGYWGPAISHDLVSWRWLEPDRYRAAPEDRRSFAYTFGKNENCVYFSHNMLYNPEHFRQADFPQTTTLCHDRDGTPVPLVSMGDGNQVILMTARHHACEAPAGYMLEGVLRELQESPLQGYRILAVPFVDLAGVIAGDQGKCRLPHDHNRDYIPESLYPTVKAIKALLAKEHVVYAFDFHDPCHIGPGNDYTRLVNAYESMREDMNRFSALYAEETENYTGEICFPYEKGKVTWRDQPAVGTFSAYCGGLETVEFVATIEAPYFGKQDRMMTRESYLATGRAFARTIKRFIG